MSDDLISPTTSSHGVSSVDLLEILNAPAFGVGLGVRRGAICSLHLFIQHEEQRFRKAMAIHIDSRSLEYAFEF